MAGPLAFHFQPGASVLHRFDPRFKTISLILLSPCVMAAFPWGLTVFSSLLIIAIVWSGLDWRSAVYQMRYFGIILVAVFISRSIFMPGKPIIILGPVIVTCQGISSGALFCWRLILVTSIGLVYAATTRSREIRASVEWLMSPIPGIPEKRVGIMVGLVVRLIPMILDQAQKTIIAQKARCVECRKNPYYRLTYFAMPMLRKTLKQADRLALALAARCYNESGTPPFMKIRRADWLWLAGLFGLCMMLAWPDLFS